MEYLLYVVESVFILSRKWLNESQKVCKNGRKWKKKEGSLYLAFEYCIKPEVWVYAAD